jgi:hypothetical protein
VFGKDIWWELQSYDVDCKTVLISLQDFVEVAAYKTDGIETARCVIYTTERVEDQLRR